MKSKSTGNISYFGKSKTYMSLQTERKEDNLNPFDKIDYDMYEKTQIKRKVLGYVSKPD